MDGALKRFYDHFICHDQHDFLVFKKICQQAKDVDMPPCLIKDYDTELYNVEDMLPNKNVMTLYHVVGCNEKQYEAVVLNFLTDMVS